MPSGAHVATVEHLLAALSGIGIDNCLIEIDGAEVPVMDGSAREFVEAIDRAGVVAQNGHQTAVARDTRNVDFRVEPVPFGPGERLPAVEVHTELGTLRLRGRIDRLDVTAGGSATVVLSGTLVNFESSDARCRDGWVRQCHGDLHLRKPESMARRSAWLGIGALAAFVVLRAWIHYGGPEPFAPHDAPFWDDPYIASRMLEAHLDPSTDAASRRPATIERTVDHLTAADAGAILGGLDAIEASPEALTALHLPIALWLMVGIAYAGGRWSQVAGRMDFVRFSGELFIYYVLIALGGGVLTAFMAMIFEAINGQPPETVLAIPADFVRQVMDKLGLGTREVGLNAMVQRLKLAAAQAAEGHDPTAA